jgi:hypothetical protein
MAGIFRAIGGEINSRVMPLAAEQTKANLTVSIQSHPDCRRA